MTDFVMNGKGLTLSDFSRSYDVTFNGCRLKVCLCLDLWARTLAVQCQQILLGFLFNFATGDVKMSLRFEPSGLHEFYTKV